MSHSRKVKYLLPAVEIDMGGTPVKQAFPTNKVDQIDPFLLLHHASFDFTADAPALQQGIGPHPHRGFTPVTFIIDGEVQHRDSRGNNQIGKKGDLQWLHAGAGIVHSERPSQALTERNGRQEIIQLWINTPAAKKMQQPLYQFFTQSQLPIVSTQNDSITSRLVAGTYNRKTGPVKTESELLIIWSETQKAGKQSFIVPKEMNAMLYLVHGNLRINGYGVIKDESLIIFENNSEEVNLEVMDNSNFIILSGIPIDEKIARFGPYVMNNQTEILKAMRDYQMGKMGILIEEK